MSTTINVHHVTRVEGHGNIVVEVAGGELKDCRFEVVETPRFFEAMLRGRPYQEAPQIASRICGICSTGHTITSLRAVEKALGIQPGEQTVLLRRLAMDGEILDSHILHVYMLVAPDFLGVESVIPLASSHPEVLLRALRMKQLAGDLCAQVAGRHTHPIAMTVGGFTHFPSAASLEALHRRLLAARPDVDASVELFASLPWPEYQRDTNFISLTSPSEYAFIDGDITTSEGACRPVEDYRAVVDEYLVPYSTAKHAHHDQAAYMVGALARFNNNHNLLQPRAQSAAAAFRLKPKVINPYLNSAAQVVEIVHCLEDAIQAVEQLLAQGMAPQDPPAIDLSGLALPAEGVGACEVPRGLLVHHYQIGADGNIAAANCLIPTNQNLANLDADLRDLVPQILYKPAETIQLDLEMLVRAYDPCISCAVHVLSAEPL
jgi:sulfhydrogenase subunit alpha